MTEISFYKKPNYIKTFSKNLKQNQTESEKILREILRSKKFYGLKFHRQKPLFVYRESSGIDRFFIADFYYHPKKLIIEIDGKIHDRKDNKDYDKLREYLLKESGYIIIRFTNNMIMLDIENVLNKIKNFVISHNQPLTLRQDLVL